MITGYNTDTKHDGVVYHVQTEDGGAENPYVVTLVYRGGRILASKKTGYAELLGTPDLVNRVRTMLEKQHRLMMAAVNAGMLAEGGKLEAKAAAALQRDGLAPGAAGPAAVSPANQPRPAAPPVAADPAPPKPIPGWLSSPRPATLPPPLGQSARSSPSKPAAPSAPSNPSAVGPPAVSPAPAGSNPSKSGSHDEKSLDQVILEFLASELGKK